jgi:hypothetical protein
VESEHTWHSIGDRVQRARPIDAIGHTKQLTGPILTVTKIRNHKPIDGPEMRNTVAELDDGSWDFVWNLY